MTRRFGAAILGCAGTRLGADEKRFFARADPFGFILFARNIENVSQVANLTEELRDAVGREAPILIDQEGGRVQRYRPPLGRDWLPPLDEVARHGANAARAMRLRYRLIAHELRGMGITANCAPMLDIARPDTHAFLRNRCYADSLDRVVEIGRAVVEGLEQGGICPVVKHIPGHGRAVLDSHLSLPRIAADRATLDAADFAAFRPFAGQAMGMTAHLVFDAIDPGNPATISTAMIDLIRRDIGFGGLLMTDDISMQALSGTVSERGAAALAAGCDVVLHCNGDLAEMQALMDLVGTMSDAAQARADAVIAACPAVQPVDIDALEAEFEALGHERHG
ncbi:beta-hexosaminidase [Thalassococcus sp. CAU 1522]|uniref:Beta-hexosaminidase n=1 Tax=Thalassococcus arenae TaxID=2851652 RepID=A0ABS6NB41_9RHOB|nr:beta-hexosaminidase [Thalassococcus arenae]